LLTELEGAILSEIHHRGQKTAFQVRKAFAASFSLEWKGSAGAIYPAVKRLEERGYIQASVAQDGRATRQLSLTRAGRESLMAWACDPTRAISVGIDPFRLRAGIWTQLTPGQRKKTFAAIRKEIEASIPIMEKYLAELDQVEYVRIELGIALQRARLEILDRWSR
jgi:DNA-binding PadR family transcriptional regulator